MVKMNSPYYTWEPAQTVKDTPSWLMKDAACAGRKDLTWENKMASKTKMKILSKAIDGLGLTLRPGMLQSIEDGMKSRKKATLKKYGYLTANYLMDEIRQDIPFQEQMARINITLEDMEGIANRIVREHEEGPISFQKVGRNEPCPCGSGKKYKKCCGR